jgi:micrococcal nuclease
VGLYATDWCVKIAPLKPKMARTMIKSTLATLILCLSLNASALALDKVRVTYVSDGDTIHIYVDGHDRRLRLIGIDTPESSVNDRSTKQAHHSERRMEDILSLGERAKSYVETLVHKGDMVELEYDIEREDKYHRLLGYVYLPNGKMLNEQIIKNGYAKPMTFPPNVRYVNKFLKAYDEARKSKLGLWAN